MTTSRIKTGSTPRATRSHALHPLRSVRLGAIATRCADRSRSKARRLISRPLSLLKQAGPTEFSKAHFQYAGCSTTWEMAFGEIRAWSRMKCRSNSGFTNCARALALPNNWQTMRGTMKITLSFIAALTSVTSALAADVYVSDPPHTQAFFETGHLGISWVRGRFKDVD